MSPKNTGIKIGIVAAIAFTIIFVVVANLLLPSRLAPRAGDYSNHYASLYPTTIEGLAASCTDINFFSTLNKQNYAILPQGIYDNKAVEVPRFETVLPVTGYMAPTVLPDSDIKYYSRTKDPHFTEAQILRLQYEQGTIVIWYSAGTAPAELTSIQKLIKNNKNIMALPWDEEEHKNNPLPNGTNLAFTTFGVSQACFAWNPTVLFNLQTFVKQHPLKHVQPAPTATLNSAGRLPQVDSVVLAALARARRLGQVPPASSSASPTPSATPSVTITPAPAPSSTASVQPVANQGSGVYLSNGAEVDY